jgi:hypothetical protein
VLGIKGGKGSEKDDVVGRIWLYWPPVPLPAPSSPSTASISKPIGLCERELEDPASVPARSGDEMILVDMEIAMGGA